MRTRAIFASALLVAVTTIVAQIATSAENADELRGRAKELAIESKKLKPEAPEKAARLQQEADALRRRADQVQPREPAEQEFHRRVALKEELEDLRAELKELRQAGKEERAADVQREIARIEERLEAQKPDMRKKAGPVKEPLKKMQPGPGMAGMPPEHREMVEAHRRLHHLRVAIENLHMAGLHEPAERLEQEARRMKEHLRSGADAMPMRPVPPREFEANLDQLRAEVKELREAVKELHRRSEGKDRPE